MYAELEHPALGTQKFQSPPFKLSKSPAVIERPAPLIGQHTREVLEELLDMKLDDIRAGYEDGTFWPVHMPTYPYIEEALQ
jgi:crotonobetainyl-CoA:carnitine CoA-transferase CaiB-like acyl-CoA transferase